MNRLFWAVMALIISTVARADRGDGSVVDPRVRRCIHALDQHLAETAPDTFESFERLSHDLHGVPNAMLLVRVPEMATRSGQTMLSVLTRDNDRLWIPTEASKVFGSDLYMVVAGPTDQLQRPKMGLRQVFADQTAGYEIIGTRHDSILPPPQKKLPAPLRAQEFNQTLQHVVRAQPWQGHAFVNTGFGVRFDVYYAATLEPILRYARSLTPELQIEIKNVDSGATYAELLRENQAAFAGSRPVAILYRNSYFMNIAASAVIREMVNRGAVPAGYSTPLSAAVEGLLEPLPAEPVVVNEIKAAPAQTATTVYLVMDSSAHKQPYLDLARQQKWRMDEIDATISSVSGPSTVMRVSGPGVGRLLDGDQDSGVTTYAHVPARDLTLEDADLEISTTRSKGGGTKSENSAVRVRDLPSDLTIKVDGRGGKAQNQEMVLSLLRAMLSARASLPQRK